MEETKRCKNPETPGSVAAQRKKMTKEQIRLAIIKKKECEEKALTIVYQLIEPLVDEEWLLDNLKFISKCHMEDVIEERAITKLCGYVLCHKPIVVTIKQKYHISLKDKKVYDMTKRKNFCSSDCFGASNYLLEQLLTSPLWIRDKEEIPEFKIIPTAMHNKIKTSLGEVDISLIPKTSLDESNSKKQYDFTNEINDITKNEQNDVQFENSLKQELSREIDELVLQTAKYLSSSEEKEENLVAQNSTVFEKIESNHKNIDMLDEKIEKNFKKETNKFNDQKSIETNEYQNFYLQEITSSLKDDYSISDAINLEQLKKEVFPENFLKQITPNKNCNSLEMESCKVETCNETKTLNKSVGQLVDKTIKEKKPSLFKQKKSQASVVEKSKLTEDKKSRAAKPDDIHLVAKVEQSFKEWITAETTQFLFGNDDYKQKVIQKIEHQDKYSNLCEKLNRLQFEEEQEDSEILEEKSTLKPLPHFSVLQEEGKKLELKVRAFYEGKMTIKDDTDFIEEEPNLEGDAVLPLIESHSPQALRRKIFLEKLDKTIPELLKTLLGNNYKYTRICQNYTSIKSSTVKALIRTFFLSSKNIIFKSVEWTLVGLIIIKMLSTVDPTLNNLLSTKQANMYMSMILTTYHLNANYLDFFIDSLDPNNSLVS